MAKKIKTEGLSTAENQNLLQQNEPVICKVKNSTINPAVIKSASKILSKHKYAFKVLAKWLN